MTENEVWVPVRGQEGAYEVSDLGRVRSLDRIVHISDGRKRLWAGQVLNPFPKRRGRLAVGINDRHVYVHKLVLEAFVGLRPERMEGCHNNGDYTDNRLVNLRWDTQSENMRDRVRHGTHHCTVKTHCPRGHPLAMPNLTLSAYKRGFRNCLACSRGRGRLRGRGTCTSDEMQAVADACYAEIVARGYGGVPIQRGLSITDGLDQTKRSRKGKR